MKCNHNSPFWIKAEVNDVQATLQESLQREWIGEVDLLDGKLQDIQTEYEARILSFETITKDNTISREDLAITFAALIAALEEDISWWWSPKSSRVFSLKVQQSQYSSLDSGKALIGTFQTLLEQASFFKEQISTFIADLNSSLSQAPVAPNWRLWLKQSPGYLQFLWNLFKKKTICTTHILVFMVANKQRICKPYAIPNQYVPYKVIRDQEVRDLTKKIKIDMTKAHLKVVSMYSFLTQWIKKYE